MTGLYRNDPLYLAIMTNDMAKYFRLKAQGAALSDHVRYALTHGVGSVLKQNEYSDTWRGHIRAVEKMNEKKLIAVLRNLREEIGAPMYYSSSYQWERLRSFYSPVMFACVLDCFDNRKIPKKQILQRIIDSDKSELLIIAANHGWLKMPKKRDELIMYAAVNTKTECLAWLLDFKNRTADVEEERKREEQKLLRELNAAPDSVTELKRLWGYKKQEDGTLVITSCKKPMAVRSRIAVPEKIGSAVVSAIGDYAFSCYAPRIDSEAWQYRQSISEIRLPPTIKIIGKSAFEGCDALEKINIPEGTEEIDIRAFANCKKLKEIILPSTLLEMAPFAFTGSGLESVVIPEKIRAISAFSDCEYLKEIFLPKSLILINVYAFGRCSSLKEIRVPDKTSVLGEYCFYYCEGLEKITLSAGTEKIEKYAFEYCVSLKTVDIPEGVLEIGACAFAKCASLETVYFPRSLKKIQNLSVKGHAPVSVFYDSPKVTAAVYKDSYAERYCKRNNIPYTIREEA